MLRLHVNLKVAKPQTYVRHVLPKSKMFAIGIMHDWLQLTSLENTVHNNAASSYLRVSYNNLFTMRTSILYEEKKSGFLKGITSKIKTIISGQENSVAQEQTVNETKVTSQSPKSTQSTPTQPVVDSATQQEISKFAKDSGLTEEEVTRAEAASQQGQVDMNVFRVHLKTLSTTGGIKTALKFVPGVGQFKEAVDKATSAGGVADPVEIQKQIALIDAMTEEERKNPQLLTNHGFKAKQRIAKATGQDINNINRLLQTYEQFKFLQTKMLEFQKLGKMPTTMQEMIQMMSQGGHPSKKDVRGLQGKFGK